MILDRIQRAAAYQSLFPRLAQGFAFLAGQDLTRLSPGKVEIDGEQLFAIVAAEEGRGREQALLEAHRKYLDIQYVVSGADQIGWMPIEDCQRVKLEYDATRDVALFYDRPDTWLVLPAGSFAIFLPQDAHAPLAGSGRVHKVVVKVALPS